MARNDHQQIMDKIKEIKDLTPEIEQDMKGMLETFKETVAW
jgi:hypothetical protein